MKRWRQQLRWTVLLLVMAALCGAFPATAQNRQIAVVSTAAPDYSSGAHAVIDVDPVAGPRHVQANLVPTASDITVAAHGQYFYRIGRLQADHVTKFHMDAPETPIWQFSTLGPADDGTANPTDMAFVSDQKAYLFRMGSTKAWIVNPSASSEAEFKIGELDLSAYADSDGNPEMYSGTIVGDKLFVALRRQDRQNNWISSNTPYLAVFDTSTDTEIDTGLSQEGLAGIPLPVKNPGTLIYLPENQTLYLLGQGQYESSWSGTPAEYSGGIVAIDPQTYQVTRILDDDTDGDGVPVYGGNFSGMAILSPSQGYLTVYAGWGDNAVRTFNPSTGQVGEVVAGLSGKNIAGMDAGTYVDKNGMLWVCNQTDARVDIIDPATHTIDESVPTELNPQKVVFCGETGAANQLYFPHVASDGHWETEIGLVNDSDGAISGTLHGYDAAGNPISDIPVSLAGRARGEWTVGTAFANFSDIRYIAFETAASLESCKGYLKFYVSGHYRTAIPAQAADPGTDTLYLPHIASDGQWWTGLALVNTGDTAKTLNFAFNNGTVVQKTLVSGGHQAFTMAQLFDGNPPENLQSARISGAGGVIGLSLYGSTEASGNHYLAGVRLTGQGQTRFYIPHLAWSKAGWWTGIVAYNSSQTQVDSALWPYMASGFSLGQIPNSMGPGEKLVQSTQAMEAMALPLTPDWLLAELSQPVVGFGLFGTLDGKVLAGFGGQNLAKTSGLFPKIEDEGWTGIALVNTQEETILVQLSAYDDAGNLIASRNLGMSGYFKTVNLAQDLFEQSIAGASFIRYEVVEGKKVAAFQLNGSADGMMLDGLPAL